MFSVLSRWIIEDGKLRKMQDVQLVGMQNTNPDVSRWWDEESILYSNMPPVVLLLSKATITSFFDSISHIDKAHDHHKTMFQAINGT